MSTEERALAGRYVLGDPIGRGGMGEVWRATDTVLGREVAVKTIDLGRVPDEAGAARFEREAKVTAGISHPNVVTVHDTGVEGDTAYLVMELLPGPSLAQQLADGPLPVEEVVSVGRQVASALEAAHARGLVHRDIKPGNVVHADDGRVRVVDFGITQLGEATGGQALTATNTVMGTAEYLAPEQALGQRVDGRADLYALGCVLYALLAGRPPFSAATPVATVMQHTSDPAPDVRALRPDTPAWLASLVAALLAKDPADRPVGAAAVVESLTTRTAPAVAGAAAATTVIPASGADPTQRLSRTAPVPPVPPPPLDAGPTTRSERYDQEPRRGSSAPLWVIALVALAAVALLGWYLFLGPGASDDPSATPSSTPTTSAPSSAAPETSEPAPTTSAPEPTPSPSESPTADDPAQAVSDASAALADEVDALDREGGIDKDAAKTLQQEIRDIDKALRDGDAGTLVDVRNSMLEEYGTNVDSGAIPPEAADRLDPLVQDLADAVDAYDEAQG
ncbi:serine/threonine-protein kinase [Phycicoccus sonneratiae]|uniref:non-specific serine/threonine protein kinase n=1 Tax=Phycicoccus sonneratiae TaxID=2807628 RepID=A0ABS2CIJ2_9MICO|nr:serine/threonine-protein kinase [Phycicoccus sonneraticus]MBM6399595.1 protein kinase [Phycicoccus sonneraticus]